MPIPYTDMREHNETGGWIAALLLVIFVAGIYYYSQHNGDLYVHDFTANNYLTHTVIRVSRDGMVLLDNDDDVSPGQFINGSASLIRVGDVVDVVYADPTSLPRSIKAARIHPPGTPVQSPSFDSSGGLSTSLTPHPIVGYVYPSIRWSDGSLGNGKYLGGDPNLELSWSKTTEPASALPPSKPQDKAP